jgi:hypothetical protein
MAIAPHINSHRFTLSTGLLHLSRELPRSLSAKKRLSRCIRTIEGPARSWLRCIVFCGGSRHLDSILSSAVNRRWLKAALSVCLQCRRFESTHAKCPRRKRVRLFFCFTPAKGSSCPPPRRQGYTHLVVSQHSFPRQKHTHTHTHTHPPVTRSHVYTPLSQRPAFSVASLLTRSKDYHPSQKLRACPTKVTRGFCLPSFLTQRPRDRFISQTRCVRHVRTTTTSMADILFFNITVLCVL